jgi:hypothetical protein
MFMEEYCLNPYTSQSDMQIQCNPIEISKVFLTKTKQKF